MAYEKHTWANGEIITASKMNNIENGIKTVDGIKNITAQTEPTNTAGAAHAKGSYLIYDDNLYKVTADIAIGDTLATTGTGANIAQVTGGAMGEVIKLKSAIDNFYTEEETYNLFDADEIIYGTNLAIASGGVGTVESSSKICSVIIPVEPLTLYRITKDNATSRFVYGLFTTMPSVGDTTNNTANMGSQTDVIFSTGENDAYLFLVLCNTNNNTIESAISNLLVKKGGNVAQYIEAKTQVLKTQHYESAIRLVSSSESIYNARMTVARRSKSATQYTLGWRAGGLNSNGGRNGTAGYVRMMKSKPVDPKANALMIYPPHGLRVQALLTNVNIYSSDSITVYDYQFSDVSKPIYVKNVPGAYLTLALYEVTDGYDDVDNSQIYRPAYERDIILDTVVLAEYSGGVVTPEQYGAVGDGITDDSEALQSAIDNYMHVVLRGRYLIKSGLKIKKSHLFIIGENGGAIIADKTLTEPMINFVSEYDDISDITIKGVEFDGGNSSQARTYVDEYNKPCIYGMPAHECTISDIRIEDCYIHSNGKAGDGIYFGDNHNGGHADSGDIPYDNTTGADSVYDITIRNCIIEDVADGIKNSHISVSIEGCTIRRCKSECITLDWACRRCRVIDNLIGPHYGGCGSIAIDGSREVLIANNIIDEQNYKFTLSAKTATRTGITFNGHTDEAKDYTVTGNIIRGCAGPCISIGANSKTVQDRPLINGVIANNILAQAPEQTSCPSIYVWQHDGNGDISVFGNTFVNSVPKIGYSSENDASVECLKLFLGELSITPQAYECPTD